MITSNRTATRVLVKDRAEFRFTKFLAQLVFCVAPVTMPFGIELLISIYGEFQCIDYGTFTNVISSDDHGRLFERHPLVR